MTSRIWIAVGALLIAGSPIAAQEQQYPSRQIELVVPFPAGGGADVSARMVAQIAGDSLGQPVVVQNKGGATGAIGSEYVARATPDGYTLLLATGSTHAVLPAYRTDLPYDTVTSFAPATLVAIIPNMLVVNPKKVPVASVAELIKYLKDNPGKLNFASSGPGSSIHFAGELFKLMTRTEMTHVSYRGSAPALNDLLAGSVDLIFDNMPVVWPQVQQGNLRALGVASLERTPLAPQVPAIAETLPGFEAVSWVGIVAPAGTPAAIVDKISAGLRSRRAAPGNRQPASGTRIYAGPQHAGRVYAIHPRRPREMAARRARGEPVGEVTSGHRWRTMGNIMPDGNDRQSARPCRLPTDGLGREHRRQGTGRGLVAVHHRRAVRGNMVATRAEPARTRAGDLGDPDGGEGGRHRAPHAPCPQSRHHLRRDEGGDPAGRPSISECRKRCSPCASSRR